MTKSYEANNILLRSKVRNRPRAGGKPNTVHAIAALRLQLRGEEPPSLPGSARALAMPPQTDQMQYSPSSQRQNMPVVIIPIKLGTSYGI